MKKHIKNSILEHYLELYKKFGVNSKALGWINGRQSIRFETLSQIGNLSDSSILDVGCGFGDLFGFLKYKKIKCQYLGLDINKKFLELAKIKYPDGNFELRDIQAKKISKKFDWIIATGLTNQSGTYPHIKNLLSEMFRICKKGVAMDFISNYVDYKDKNIFYTSPEVMFKFSKKLTKRVTLRHDYMPFEFCLYLYKNYKKNSKNVFSEYYNILPKPIQNDSWLNK